MLPQVFGGSAQLLRFFRREGSGERQEGLATFFAVLLGAQIVLDRLFEDGREPFLAAARCNGQQGAAVFGFHFNGSSHIRNYVHACACI